MKKVLLKIDGMTCSACSSGLEKYLNKQDGIKEAVVNLVMNNASVEYDDTKLTLEQVEKFVEKAGFTSLGIDNFEKDEKKKSNEKYKLIGITIISLLVLYIFLLHQLVYYYLEQVLYHKLLQFDYLLFFCGLLSLFFLCKAFANLLEHLN